MLGPCIQSWKKVSTIAKHIQTQSEWEQTMARRVMEQLRGELYLDQRYLTAALGALPAAPQESGGALYYPTAWLLDTYRRNRRYLPRAYLHSLFHCIFRHLWLRDRRDPDLWGLACDIAVEATLDTLNTPATKRPVGWVLHTAARKVQIFSGRPHLPRLSTDRRGDLKQVAAGILHRQPPPLAR